MLRQPTAFARHSFIRLLTVPMLGFGFVAAPANAAVVESSMMTNSYSYTIGGQSGSSSDAGGDTALLLDDNSGGQLSEMKLDLTASLNSGSFYFLHDAYCVGTCSVSMTTQIVFTLTNNGTTAENLRFDSLITPGHLANAYTFGGVGNANANFDFNVAQTTGQASSLLYGAVGSAIDPAQGVFTTGSDFNGVQMDDNPPLWSATDWSATVLSIDLNTIAPGETSSLVYTSTLQISNFAQCTDLTSCTGFQVAFGDPRNNGGVSLFSAFSLFSAPSLFSVDPLQPAVGAEFDPFLVPYRFVPQGSPPPPTPPVIYPGGYDVGFLGNNTAVPEPSAWALMIVGFLTIGAAMRRTQRRALLPA